MWDSSAIGDSCAGDIGNPLFGIDQHDRFYIVGLRSYVETNQVSNSFFLSKSVPIFAADDSNFSISFFFFVSWNVIANLQEIADPSDLPGVFVKIGGFLNWIAHVMDSNEEKEKVEME